MWAVPQCPLKWAVALDVRHSIHLGYYVVDGLDNSFGTEVTRIHEKQLQSSSDDMMPPLDDGQPLVSLSRGDHHLDGLL